MQVHFTQMYIEPGVWFPFSTDFQHRIADAFTALVEPSPKFIKKYGSEFDLTFYVSAKNSITENEIRGPTVFKKTKDVEYTVFLPFDTIMREAEPLKSALTFLINGACKVLNSLDIDAATISERHNSLIEDICSDPSMFDGDDDWNDAPGD